MPGFDGKGPRGLGPMTGGGRGFCVLKLPDKPDEPVVESAGRAGWSVGRESAGNAELAQLRRQAARIEATLRVISRRIEFLQSNQKQAAVGV